MAEKDRVNILLVDDQPNNLLALEAMLEDLDENLVRAESGDKALKALLDQDFAVVLLDVQMPGLDGFETAEIIRQREKSRYTPIIFVTALSRSETNVFKGYSLGAVDYLFKPIVPEILRSKVAVFVDLFRKNSAVRNQALELSRLSRQTELILNSAADGVIGVDTSGHGTFINPAALRMLAASAENVVGRDVHDMVHPQIGDVAACDRKRCCVRAALLGDEMSDIQDQGFWRSDGTNFPVEFSAAPMRSRGDDLVGAVLSFRDVSEKRAAARAKENERLYREAEAASIAKDDFLASLSHELRTPMTAILGWLQMLRLEGLDEGTRQEGLQTIESSARLQAQLIDDMLDVSRIIMGKFRVTKVPTDLVPLAASAIETLRPIADEKGVGLQANLGASETRVCVDGARIRQVLSNLLSNAIKFTPTGGRVTVDVQTVGDSVVLNVTDTGEGLSSELIPLIFERLQQSDSARNLGGLGLGLAIARHIVELHEGTIEAHSEGIGRGSTFTVSLPLLVTDEVRS
ncbi:MAG TPA: ATP-binding protein [Thermoanaerobaculia bacterium]|nr:ATP-binding protein [Thermoanaerobaculia bacterium]